VAAEVKTLTDATFDSEVSGARTPMIVDFWAPWCGPCRMVGPVIEEIAQDHDGKVVVGKVNVDENPGIASKFGIMSIPTIILF
jgi:thioredoxin 1